ncbi:MAG: hypothetical protein ACRENI_05210 [Gemmatimonadaceae bacterium]
MAIVRPRLTWPSHILAEIVGSILFQSVSAGQGPHTCGVTVDDRVYCWGYNSAGQLGYGQKDFLPGTVQHERTIPVELFFLQ